jgi:transposase
VLQIDVAPWADGCATSVTHDARGIAEMMRIGHYRPVHVKSAEAQLIRTTLQARRQIVATLLQIQGSIRGLLRMHGLKAGEIHRNRFETRVRELLEEMPSSVSPSSHCCGCWSSLFQNERRWTSAWERPRGRTRCACV